MIGRDKSYETTNFGLLMFTQLKQENISNFSGNRQLAMSILLCGCLPWNNIRKLLLCYLLIN